MLALPLRDLDRYWNRWGILVRLWLVWFCHPIVGFTPFQWDLSTPIHFSMDSYPEGFFCFARSRFARCSAAPCNVADAYASEAITCELHLSASMSLFKACTMVRSHLHT